MGEDGAMCASLAAIQIARLIYFNCIFSLSCAMALRKDYVSQTQSTARHKRSYLLCFNRHRPCPRLSLCSSATSRNNCLNTYLS